VAIAVSAVSVSIGQTSREVGGNSLAPPMESQKNPGCWNVQTATFSVVMTAPITVVKSYHVRASWSTRDREMGWGERIELTT
jgi:hypothetical protein